ncbi:hypothetical protein BGW38_008975 [Lunasporangiospora selenospora]|uniref:Uncharacterized protein n=1 Tax=Lunasporangiospora selenospora TaxID=979761 RepID=A0A9P6FKL9_9FUNG|nr:hypothetical protein BGW38_008975 [Lunasporangiospora selenospora]
MLPTPTTPWSLPVKEEDVSALISFASSRPMTRADSISSLALSQADDHRRYSSRSHDENQDEADLDEHDAEVLKMETEYAHSMQSSRSSSMGLSVYSREASPCSSSSSTSSSPMTLSRGSGMATYGMLSEASTSMSSLASNESTLSLAMSESSIGSSSKEGILSSPISNRISASTMSMSSTSQLLLCPPSKNQNCNLRRHLKNVHNMSPTIHPRKCKWDSLPDGRVKDDKDRKERTRKSKRLWARKFRQKRKVEEAAIVLSMLCQAA